MKRLVALVALALTISASAFASDVVGHGVKDTGKVVTVATKDTAKAGVHVLKFLF